MVRCYESRTGWMVSQVSGEGRPGAESSCSDLTDRPSTICFCGCQYAPHSPNYQGIQRGGLENAKSLIQSIKPFVFCWVSNDYAISCRGTDLASHRAGLINRHLILYTSQRRQTQQWDLERGQQIYKLWHLTIPSVCPHQTLWVLNKWDLYLPFSPFTWNRVVT